MSRVIEFLKNFVKMKYLKSKIGKQNVNVNQGPRVGVKANLNFFRKHGTLTSEKFVKTCWIKAVGGDESARIQPYDTEEPK